MELRGHSAGSDSFQMIGFAVLDQLSETLPGRLYSIDDLNQETQDRGMVMDGPPASLIQTGVGRDWPDGRALW